MADNNKKPDSNNRKAFRDNGAATGAGKQQIDESLRDGVNRSNNVARTNNIPDKKPNK